MSVKPRTVTPVVQWVADLLRGVIFLFILFSLCVTIELFKMRYVRNVLGGVKTLRTQDTSDPRHFGSKEDTSALRYTGWQGG